MTPSLSFIICTERGYLEPMSVLFAMSLRTFGGALSSAPVFSFQPRPGYQISEETHRALADLDVEHHEILLNTRYSNDPLANKPLTAAFAEKELNHEYLVFADSDQIILNEPSALCLPAGFDVGLRPVHKKNVGAYGKGDPNYPYWQKLYSLLEVDEHTYVHTTIGGHRILSYWNSGLVAVRRESGLFSLWASNFHKTMKKGLKPPLRRFVEQTVLSATVVSKSAEVFRFSNDYNYPIHRHNEIPKETRVEHLRDMTTVHYHKMFRYLKSEHPLSEFLGNDDMSKKIKNQMDISGVYPESAEAREKYLHRIFGGS